MNCKRWGKTIPLCSPAVAMLQMLLCAGILPHDDASVFCLCECTASLALEEDIGPVTRLQRGDSMWGCSATTFCFCFSILFLMLIKPNVRRGVCILRRSVFVCEREEVSVLLT